MILKARRVGPTGKAYGLDMTDEMLQRRSLRNLEPPSLRRVVCVTRARAMLRCMSPVVAHLHRSAALQQARQ